jgi:hypothetical protein
MPLSSSSVDRRIPEALSTSRERNLTVEAIASVLLLPQNASVPQVGSGEMGTEPIDGSVRRRLEFTEIGIEMSALDHNELLGFERPLVRFETVLTKS